ncbi:MAG: Fe-S protein assembly co-chaperone HscB [Serpentinimonas sp.]|nr:Fe-S protein assembly co-chaperone HscB [Serpentinimonas sp.]
MNLQDTDFALMGLPERFALERATLDERWKQLQREVHPDRFASQGAAAQRVAMQWSMRVNEAYARLKDPLQRASYLCELRGARIDAERNTAMPAAFLMQQMEWREALDEAADEAALDALLAQTRAARQALLVQLEQQLDATGAPDASQAAESVRALMFVERFSQEVQTRMDRLLDLS